MNKNIEALLEKYQPNYNGIDESVSHPLEERNLLKDKKWVLQWLNRRRNNFQPEHIPFCAFKDIALFIRFKDKGVLNMPEDYVAVIFAFRPDGTEIPCVEIFDYIPQAQISSFDPRAEFQRAIGVL